MKLEAVAGIENNEISRVTARYLAEYDTELQWRPATIAEFNQYHNLDELMGYDGDSLDPRDIIVCSDGEIEASEIL